MTTLQTAAQAVEPVNEDAARAAAWEILKPQLGTEGWTVGDHCNYLGFFGWGWEARRQYTHPTPPPAGERAELIAAIKHELAEFAHNKTLETLLLDAADMLEADAQDAFTVGLACQPTQGSNLPLDLLERLSKTLTKLGYSTPEGGMEHFGALIESQLYNLCRGVDSLLAQQVAVPVPLSGYEISKWWASENGLEDCDMFIHGDFEKVVRAIEARYKIGAKK